MVLTCTTAMASTAPAAPSKWPIIDFVEFTLNCAYWRSCQHHKEIILQTDSSQRNNYYKRLITPRFWPKQWIRAWYSLMSPAGVDVACAFI